MARYLVVEGSFWDGSRGWQQGEVATIPDGQMPSKKLLPLDKAAQAALAKIGVEVAIYKPPKTTPPEEETLTFREAAEGKASPRPTDYGPAKKRTADE